MPTNALQMVNRVLRKLGKNDVSAFQIQDRSQVALDAVNEAARDILESESWDFLKRRDGELQLHGDGTTTAADASVFHSTGLITIPSAGTQTGFNSSTFGITSLGITTLLGRVGRLIVTSAPFDEVFYRGVAPPYPTYGNTAFRMVSYQVVPNSNTFLAEIATPYNGATSRTANIRMYVNEYVLPTTVAAVISARFEENEIHVEQVDESFQLDHVFPRPHDDSGEPEFIAVGGVSVATTTDRSDPEPEPGLRLLVYPVPDADYILHYTYDYRPAALSTTTDVLKGVPEHVIDDIVLSATARMQLTTGESEMELGVTNLRLSADAVRDKVARTRADRGRRPVLRSLDSKGRGRRYPNLPRNTYGSL